MTVPALIVAEPGDGVLGLVGDAVQGEDLGVHPDAVALRLQDQHLAVGADRVEVLLRHDLIAQVLPVQDEAVAAEAGLVAHVGRDVIQDRLLARALDALAHVGELEGRPEGHVDVGVDDAGHDEAAAEV